VLVKNMVVECVWYNANALKCFYKTASNQNIFFFISVNIKLCIVCAYKKNGFKGQMGESQNQYKRQTNQ